MGVTAAQLKAAYDALVATSTPTYWMEERLTDSGDLSVPDDAEYYSLQHVSDPSVRDFSGEAYSVTSLFVSAWAATRGNEYALLAAAEAALESIGWRAGNRVELPGAVRRYGRRVVMRKEH